MLTSFAQNDLDRLRSEPLYLLLPDGERERLEALVPNILKSAAHTAEPGATAQTALDLALRMAAWPRYLTTFANHPGAITRLVSLIGASPWLGQLLLARPALADELLPGRAEDGLPDRAALRRSLEETVVRCADDEESALIALCNFKHSVLLQVLALDLEGVLSLDEVSGALSDLAELLLEAVLSRVSVRQGFGPAPPVGIVAYGKLGSREMSYASDTDIVFLHDDSDADRAPALHRLVTTVNRWLTTATGAGRLYETDFRLRPYGAHGLLTSSLSGFRAYQESAAWTWEHQALTRARFVGGNAALGQGFSEARRQILGQPRDLAVLRTDVLAMRERILREHRNHSSQPQATDLFDVKHSRGGIIDVEFTVQYLILSQASAHPALLEVPDNATALSQAARLGLVPYAQAEAVTQAFRCYRQWMHRERLRGNELILVPSALAEAPRAAVLALWQHVFEKPVGGGAEQDA